MKQRVLVRDAGGSTCSSVDLARCGSASRGSPSRCRAAEAVQVVGHGRPLGSRSTLVVPRRAGARGRAGGARDRCAARRRSGVYAKAPRIDRSSSLGSSSSASASSACVARTTRSKRRTSPSSVRSSTPSASRRERCRTGRPYPRESEAIEHGAHVRVRAPGDRAPAVATEARACRGCSKKRIAYAAGNVERALRCGRPERRSKRDEEVTAEAPRVAAVVDVLARASAPRSRPRRGAAAPCGASGRSPTGATRTAGSAVAAAARTAAVPTYSSPHAPQLTENDISDRLRTRRRARGTAGRAVGSSRSLWTMKPVSSGVAVVHDGVHVTAGARVALEDLTSCARDSTYAAPSPRRRRR